MRRDREEKINERHQQCFQDGLYIGYLCGYHEQQRNYTGEMIGLVESTAWCHPMSWLLGTSANCLQSWNGRMDGVSEKERREREITNN